MRPETERWTNIVLRVVLVAILVAGGMRYLPDREDTTVSSIQFDLENPDVFLPPEGTDLNAIKEIERLDLIMVVDQRCSACRSRVGDLRSTADFANEHEFEWSLIVAGPNDPDSLYLQRIAPPDRWYLDPDGDLLKNIGVHSVPSIIKIENGIVVHSSVPGYGDWPDFEALSVNLQ